MGHAGGAESPNYRCPLVNYTDGVFRCACCGAPLFYAAGGQLLCAHRPDGVGGEGAAKLASTYLI